MGILEIRNLSVGYGDKNVVKNCSFELTKGEIIVILGSSGDGKTTLLKTIAGLLPKVSGDVYFEEKPVLGPNQKLVPGHPKIKLVNQDFNLDEYHTVEENLRLRLLSFDRPYQNSRINQLLRLTGLTRFKSAKAKDLSGGQRQRLAISRALADEPELILLDEPFNQLDFHTKNKIAAHVKSYLKKNKIGAIMVTHNGIEALEWADKIIHLRKGVIVRIDSPTLFYNHPHSLSEALFFGDVNSFEIEGIKLYFRPTEFSLKKDDVHPLGVEVDFVEKVDLGWYGAYYFKAAKRKIVLYSTEDISTTQLIFPKFLSFND